MLSILLLVFGIYTLWKVFLSYLQIKFITQKSNLAPVVLDEENYKKAAQIALADQKFAIFGAFYTFVLLIFWSIGGASSLEQVCEFSSPLANQTYFVLAFILANAALELPLEIYKKFVKDKKAGFSNITPMLFISDKIKEFALFIVIGGLITWSSLETFSYEYWWLYMFLLGSAIILIANLIYPTIIAPIFHKTQPLQDESLKNAINSLLSSCGFKSSGVFSMNASKRDNRLNAYFGGLGATKRVVLFDTLVAKLTQNEIIAVLGHELGHFKHNDLFKRMGLIFAILFAFCWILGHIPSEFYASMGLKDNGASLIVFFLLYSPILSAIIVPLVSAISRSHEFGADEFAAQTTNVQDMISALKKLGEENKAFPLSHPLYAFVHHSHPSLYERVSKLENIASARPS